MIFTYIWVFLAAIFASVEFYALAQHKEFKERGEDGSRGTFSWHIWWLRERWWGRMLAVVVWGWAFFHFFIEGGAGTTHWWDDVLVLAGLAGLSTQLGPRNSGKSRGVDG